MRYLLMSLLCLLSMGMLTAQETKPAHIHGKIQDFKGGLVTMNYYAAERSDTVVVNADGTFDYSGTVDEPQNASLSFEDYKCS